MVSTCSECTIQACSDHYALCDWKNNKNVNAQAQCISMSPCCTRKQVVPLELACHIDCCVALDCQCVCVSMCVGMDSLFDFIVIIGWCLAIGFLIVLGVARRHVKFLDDFFKVCPDPPLYWSTPTTNQPTNQPIPDQHDRCRWVDAETTKTRQVEYPNAIRSQE
jgi:hypothetical protein